MHGLSSQFLVDLFCSSTCKKSKREIGIEIERIGIWDDGAAIHYAETSRPGMEQLLTEIGKRNQWEFIRNEKSQPLGFHTPLGKVTLEPGSQLELSTDPHRDLYSLAESVQVFEKKVDEVTNPWDLRWIGLGVNPSNAPDDMDVIPSPRYHIMTEYLGNRGRFATSMMRLTSSVQVNLDYTSEKEAIEMLRTSLAAAPVSYALFSNSPIFSRQESGYLSFRSAIWRETDPDRTGLLHEVFEDGFDFNEYAKLIWNRPLMFAQDEHQHYVATEGLSLKEIAAGKMPGVYTDETNQINAIRELFTEVRLKPGYVELRSIDGLRPKERYAAAAFWMGVLYNPDARAVVLKTLGQLTPEEREQLFLMATRSGMNARVGNISLKQIASELLKASSDCLKARDFGEENFLVPIEKILEEGMNPAEKILKHFNGPWKQSLSALIEYSSEQG